MDKHRLIDATFRGMKRALIPVVDKLRALLPGEWRWQLSENPSCIYGEISMVHTSWRTLNTPVPVRAMIAINHVGTASISAMVGDVPHTIDTIDVEAIEEWLSTRLDHLYGGNMNKQQRTKFNVLLADYLEAKAKVEAAQAALGEAQDTMVAFMQEHGRPHPKKPNTADRTIKGGGYRVQWCARRHVDDGMIISWAQSHRVKTVQKIVEMVPTLNKEKFKALRELGKVPKKLLKKAQRTDYSMLIRPLRDKEKED